MENKLLKIENLKTEIEGKSILKGLNLEIGKGEVHVIMGPNGAGKSTLANTLMGHPKYKIVDAVASDTPEAVNIPQNLFDNDLLTKWAAQGDQWIYFDLGETKPVDMLSVSWMAAASRVSPFEIQVSDDGKEWTQVYSGKSTGIAADFDYYSFKETKARYIRLCVHGYNDVAGTWNSIMEVGIYGNIK
jgi:energy-coupling factor transporter ATP-binding protein EcfA2